MEILKERSDFLRHPLMEQLVTEEASISEEAVQLMKFHGSYMQDDRCCILWHRCCCSGACTPKTDAAPCLRRDKRSFGKGKFYQFMMRTRQPAGLVSNQLYLTMDDLADQVC